MSEEVYNGTVIWFSNKDGFGFIEWSKDDLPQDDMFVHFSDIEMEGYKALEKDQCVEFSIGQNHDGKPKATNVVIM